MKKNIPLIIGIAIPIIMIIFVVASIYIPTLFAKPEYDFIYINGWSYYSYGSTFTVVDGKVVKKDIPFPKDQQPPSYQQERTLYYYDALKDTSRKITLEEASKYTLDTASRSPDGYVLEQGRGGSDGIFELFGSRRDYYGRYLRKGSINKRLYLTAENGDYYNSQIQFLGWVVKK